MICYKDNRGLFLKNESWRLIFIETEGFVELYQNITITTGMLYVSVKVECT